MHTTGITLVHILCVSCTVTYMREIYAIIRLVVTYLPVYLLMKTMDYDLFYHLY